MICEATSLKKYIDKSPRLFFVYGPEIILKNDSIDHINEFYKKHGFTEKKAIFDKDFKDYPCKCGAANCVGYIVKSESRWRIKKTNTYKSHKIK